MTAVLLLLAPAAALLLALVLGRYPGERSLDDLRRRAAARSPTVGRAPALRWPRRGAPRRRRWLRLLNAMSARPPPALDEEAQFPSIHIQGARP